MSDASVQHESVWIIDTEYGYRDGNEGQESCWEPILFCAYELHTGRRIHFWENDPCLHSFVEEHSGDLFVAHNSVSEMKYVLRAGCVLPIHWFDTFVAWRCFTNKPNCLAAGLSLVLEALGRPDLVPPSKKELQKKLGALDIDLSNPKIRSDVLQYCYSDCVGTKAIFEILNPKIQPALMEVWCEYLKAIARMELRGIPFNADAYDLIYKRARSIRLKLARGINQKAEIFAFEDESPRFCKKEFLRECLQQGVNWPAKISGKTGKGYYPVDDETLKEMEGRLPLIAEVRQARKTLKALEKRTLAIDSKTNRHYFQTMPFRSVTGRNQPKNFVFAGPKWQRFLIRACDPAVVLVNVDYDGQEIGIAAALSGDRTLQQVYASPDCHMEFAIRAGAAPAGATKKTHPDIRKLYKTVNLGVLYGQTAHGISHKLGISHKEAQDIIDDHKRLFPTFWAWSERTVQAAFDRKCIFSPNLWQSRVPLSSNERTWMNWPMQAAGADIMRLTVIYLDRQRVQLLAPIHDGFLLSCKRHELETLKLAIDYACTTACEQVLGGFPLKWSISVFEDGQFYDGDGAATWDMLKTLIEEGPNG